MRLYLYYTLLYMTVATTGQELLEHFRFYCTQDAFPYDFRSLKPEIRLGQVVSVYGGHLKKREKILAFRSPGGRVRRSATRTEPEER